MVLCSCFRPATKYECSIDELGPLSKAQKVVCEQPQQPALVSSTSPVNKLPYAVPRAAPNSNLRASAPALLQHQRQSAVSAERAALSATREVMSYKISISPTAEHGMSPASSQGDAVRQDNVDTPKRSHAPAAASPEQLATQPRMSDACLPTTQKPVEPPTPADFSAAADVGRRRVAGHSDSSQKAEAAKAAAVMKTPSSGSKKTSAGGASTPASATQTTKYVTYNTPGKATTPSPSVARPTCASTSRAQAVAASMPHNNSAGHWKL